MGAVVLVRLLSSCCWYTMLSCGSLCLASTEELAAACSRSVSSRTTMVVVLFACFRFTCVTAA